MTVRLDPEQNEIGALLRLVPAWEAKRTLEIGCGDGRLTFRYAADAAQIEAIDPDEDDIAAARRATPAQLADRVRFHAIGVEAFEPDPPSERFDIALLSWSL